MINNLKIKNNFKKFVCLSLVLVTTSLPINSLAERTMTSEKTGHVYVTNGEAPTTHYVSEGDLLWGIAKLYYGNGDYSDALAKYNGVNPRNLHEGQAISIPSLDTLLTATGTEKIEDPSKPVIALPTYHTVSSSDKLWGIAKKYYGDGDLYAKLATANGLTDPNFIVDGTTLWIPTKEVLMTYADCKKPYYTNQGKNVSTKNPGNNYDFVVNYKTLKTHIDINGHGINPEKKGEEFNLTIPSLVLTTKQSKKGVLRINNYIYVTEDTIIHTFEKNETYYNLSYNYYGTTDYQYILAEYNGFRNPVVGKKVIIPSEEEIKLFGDRIYASKKGYYNVYDISMYKYGTIEYGPVIASLNGIDEFHCFDPKKLNLPGEKTLAKYVEIYNNMQEGDTLYNNYYLVKSGDNLGNIAIKYYGSRSYADYLKDINGIKGSIQPGQILYIPTLELEDSKVLVK